MVRNVKFEERTYDVTQEAEWRELMAEILKRIIRSIESGV